MGRRQVCRCAGAVQLASRAGGLEIAGVGAGRRYIILSVSHVFGRGHFEREFHKELIANCMEPCVLSWSLFIKSGRRKRSGGAAQSGSAQWRRVLLADDREANKAWCVDRQELFLYLTSQLLQDQHTWPGLQERDVCTLLLTKSILGLPGWKRAGYHGVGDVRPACMFPLVKSSVSWILGFVNVAKLGTLE